MDLDPPDIQSLSINDPEDESSSSIPSVTDTNASYEENDRTYTDENYFLPSDQLEYTRQSIMHQAFTHFLDRKLTMNAIPSDRPVQILDLGAGPGDWALAFATKFPNSTVIATDVSMNVGSSAAQSIPANLKFQVDNAKSVPWTFESGRFDFIHMRGLGGAFTQDQLASILGEAYRCLKTGGALELSDVGMVTTTHSGNLSAVDLSAIPAPDQLPEEAPSYLSIYNLLLAAAAARRAVLGVHDLSHISGPLIEAAGFGIQRTIKSPIALGEWSNNRRDHRVGRMANVAMLEGFEPRALRLLTSELGWSKDGVRDLCERVKAEVLDPSSRPAVQCLYLVARKLEVQR